MTQKITERELINQLMDVLEFAYERGYSNCWIQCFELIPESVIHPLINFAKNHLSGRFPRGNSRSEREKDTKKMIAIQDELVTQLEQWLLTRPPPPPSSS